MQRSSLVFGGVLCRFATTTNIVRLIVSNKSHQKELATVHIGGDDNYQRRSDRRSGTRHPPRSDDTIMYHQLIGEAAIDRNGAVINKIIDRFVEIRDVEKKSIPDWTIVKLASMLVGNNMDELQRARDLLQAQYMCTGATDKYAHQATIEPEQVSGSISRILTRCGRDGIDAAKQFYKLLIEMRYAKRRHDHVQCFVDFRLNQLNDLNGAVDDLNDFIDHDANNDYLASCFAILLVRAVRDDKKWIGDKVSQLASKHCTRLKSKVINYFALLANNKPIQLAEHLQRENIQLNVEEIEYIITLAKQLNEPRALTSLFEYPGLFKNSETFRRNIFNGLIIIYGRSKKVEQLNAMWCNILAREHSKDAFAEQIGRLYYYLRRLNAPIPAALQTTVDRHRETLHTGRRL